MTLAVIMGLFMNKIESKDFIFLAGMAFTYYFSKKDIVPTVS